MALINGNNANNILNGTGVADTINGLGGNDKLYGFAGNDVLDGGLGADTMYGGLGNDVYVLNSLSDQVVELAGQGIDTVRTGTTSVTLASWVNVENVVLTGTLAYNVTGNFGHNSITGNSADNYLHGGFGGNDTLNGGAGGDNLVGGAGNDLYVIDNTRDRVFEYAAQGTDRVQSSISMDMSTSSWLGEVENLTLTGSAAISGVGNAKANLIVGNAAANTLNGLGGNDVLTGGRGVDQLTGGLGADIFRFAGALDSGVDTLRDVIADFSRAQGDKVSLAAIDANPLLAGDQAFLYIGDNAFTKAGQARFDTLPNDGPGLLELNLDADAQAEVQILLNNVKDMFASDFIL